MRKKNHSEGCKTTLFDMNTIGTDIAYRTPINLILTAVNT